MNLGREIFTKIIYELFNLEACIILTVALDAEFTF